MQRNRCGILLVCALAAAIPSMGGKGVAQNGQKEPQAEFQIRTLIEAQAAAWNRGDIPAFMDGYWKSDETTFAGAKGVQRGWDGVLDRYRRTYPDRASMGHLEFSNLEIHLLSKDAAFVLGQWQLTRANDKPGGVFTLVLRRFPEGWRIVHDHTSLFAQVDSTGAKH
jgi:ketosteroid isomerase-like protein